MGDVFFLFFCSGNQSVVCMPNARFPLSYTLNGPSAKIKIEGLCERTKYRKQSQEGRKEGRKEGWKKEERTKQSLSIL